MSHHHQETVQRLQYNNKSYYLDGSMRPLQGRRRRRYVYRVSIRGPESQSRPCPSLACMRGQDALSRGTARLGEQDDNTAYTTSKLSNA